jgi:hypothetical protein
MVRLAFLTAALLLFSSAYLCAQPVLKQATLNPAGDDSFGGKCVIEVIINGAAEIDILGPTADLRSMTGEPLGWRRFECTAILPPNPDEFVFHRISGRGKVDLTRHPLLDGGGPAMFRLKSSQSSPEVFIVEITWLGKYDATTHSWRPRS